MKDSWLKRNWSIIRNIPLITGVMAIVVAILVNPVLVEMFLSSNDSTNKETVKAIYFVETFAFFVGLCLIVLFFILRAHNPKKEKWVAISIILLCCVIITIFLVEITMTVVDTIKPFNLSRHAFSQFDDSLGWVNKPNMTSSFKDATVRINNQGFRGSVVPFKKPKGEFRILFLGDSQLFADGVEEEDLFPSVLESSLPSVKTINTGVIGYGTDQELLFLKEHGRKFSPDLIIVAMNAYDLSDNVSKSIPNGYSKPIFELEGETLRLTNVPISNFGSVARMNKILQKMSHVYYISSITLNGLMAKGSAQQRTDLAKGEEQAQLKIIQRILLPEERFNKSIAVTLSILKEISSVGQSISAKTLVIFLPYEIDFCSYETYNKYVDNVTQQISDFRAEGEYFFNDFRKDMAKRKCSILYLDGRHFNKEGNKLVAEILKINLIQSHLLPSIDTR